MSDLETAIAYFESLSEEKVFFVREFDNGTANSMFLINHQFVVRIKKEDKVDAPFNTAFNEMSAIAELQKVDKHPPIPPLCHYQYKTGNKIEMYIPGAEPLLQGDLEKDYIQVTKVLEGLRLFHSAPTIQTDFLPERRFDSYKKASGKKLPDSFEEQIREKAVRALAKYPTVLCHNDLWSGNILLPKDCIRECYFIDFEFAAGNSEIFDIASLCEENEFSPELTQLTITYYYGAEQAETVKDDLKVVMTYLDALWYYWAEARFLETKNDTFARIAKTKKERFLKAFEESLMEEGD